MSLSIKQNFKILRAPPNNYVVVSVISVLFILVPRQLKSIFSLDKVLKV